MGVGGTSALALGEAIALARAMGTLPARVVVYTIEAGAVRAGDDLSPEVAQAAERLAGTILVDLALAAPGAIAGVTPAAWPRNEPVV
jgi:hydrogenase maturation protease